MGHDEDARLNPNYPDDNRENNNAAFSSERANAATRTANNAPFQMATNTNLNANPPEAVRQRLCSHCSTPGHRHPECPQRPCKHGNVMGHVGKDCPEIVEDRAQRPEAAYRRYQDNHANRKIYGKTFYKMHPLGEGGGGEAAW